MRKFLRVDAQKVAADEVHPGRRCGETNRYIRKALRIEVQVVGGNMHGSTDDRAASDIFFNSCDIGHSGAVV